MPSHVAIIDAGSSSSRLLVYRWEPVGQDQPVVLEKFFPPAGAPGGTGETPRGGGGIQEHELTMQAHLGPILLACQQHLAAQGVVGRIPLYLHATAGMRGVARKDEILAAARAVLTANQWVNTFRVKSVGVISGEYEGLFAWVAMNYGKGKDDRVSGVLELGGASMQIVYKVPDAQRPSRKVCLLSGDHMVYSKSWGTFGADSAIGRMIPKAVTAAGGDAGAGDIRNPCLPRGQPGGAYNNGARNFVGSGEFETCLVYAREILQAGVGSPHQIPPYLDIAAYGNHFYAVANFWHSYSFFAKWGGYNPNHAYDRKRFTSAVKKYCTSTWSEIPWRAGDNDATNEFRLNRCFNAAWMLNILHDEKYGFAMEMKKYQTWKDLLRFPTTDALKSRSSWTVGVAALYARHGTLTACPAANQAVLDEDDLGGFFNASDSYYPLSQPAQVEASSPTIHLVEPAQGMEASSPTIRLLHPAQGTLSAIIPQDNILIHLLSYVVILILGYQAGKTIRRRRARQTERKEKDAAMAFVA